MRKSVRAQLQSIPYPTTSFKGQTIIVTGSNSGLGLESARHFIRLGASKLILAVRSAKKGDEAKNSIEASTGRQDAIEVWPLDMLDYGSIKDFVSRCDTLVRLDVVVANADILRNTYEQSEGVELTVKVNVIETFLIAVGLFPALRRSTATTGQTGRIVITSSVMHEEVGYRILATIDVLTKIFEAKFQERQEPSIFEALNKDKKSYIADRYNTSKLLEVLLVRSITNAMQQGQHSKGPVILNTVNPGLCHSSLDKDVKVHFPLDMFMIMTHLEIRY